MEIVREYPRGTLVIGLDVQDDQIAALVQRVRSARALLAEESQQSIDLVRTHAEGEPTQADVSEPEAQAAISQVGDDEL